MKKIIFPVIAVLSGAMSSHFVSPVAAQQLALKNFNGGSYVSGGFGMDERARLRSIAKGENLELSFALRNKEYLDGANVRIKNSKGATVLETVSEGPLFYATLPAGAYTVSATALGKTLTQNVQVPTKGQARVYFAWNASNELISQSVAQR